MRYFATALALLLTTSLFAAQPPRFNYQAKLTDSNGNPLSGNHNLFLSLWQGGTNISGGTKVFEETATVPAVNGVVNHTVGTGLNQTLGPLLATMFQFSGDIYLQVGVDSDINVITPRTRLASVPFAITSGDGDARIPILNTAPLPIVISTPGSYYLTGNITGVSGQSAIEVEASGVTIDLNGYSVIGVPGSLDGIIISCCVLDNLTIMNGTVRNWGMNGIMADGSPGGHFKNLKLIDNGQSGLQGGNRTIVEDCIANFNNKLGGHKGISVFDHSIVRNCIASGNTPLVSGMAAGISAEDGCTVTGCTANSNYGFGPNSGFGIEVSDRCVVMNNTCNDNRSGATGGTATGIYTDLSCIITGNTCSTNAGGGGTSNAIGINAGVNSSALDNTCTANAGSGTGSGSGISAQSRTRIERNNCVANTGATGYGVRIANNPTGGTMIIKNTTGGNTTAGIRFDHATAVNYAAENVIEEATPISNVGSNVVGTGDRANVTF